MAAFDGIVDISSNNNPVGTSPGNGGPFKIKICLLYTSDAADERSSVDLGGRRILKKKTKKILQRCLGIHRT